MRDKPEDVVTEDDIWFWPENFKPVLSKLTLAITETIQSVTRNALQTEMVMYEKSHQSYEAMNVSGLLTNTFIIIVRAGHSMIRVNLTQKFKANFPAVCL